jgi:hypothetical protein
MYCYPDHCLRGLRTKDYISPEGILAEAFVPDPKTAQSRSDKGMETSVNWEDDGLIISITRKSLQASHGIARLSVASIREQNSRPGSLGKLTYERCPILGNLYHGNIVFADGTSPAYRRMIAGALALASCIV